MGRKKRGSFFKRATRGLKKLGKYANNPLIQKAIGFGAVALGGPVGGAIAGKALTALSASRAKKRAATSSLFGSVADLIGIPQVGKIFATDENANTDSQERKTAQIEAQEVVNEETARNNRASFGFPFKDIRESFAERA